MSKEVYNPERKDDNKVVLERLQSYLKDKRVSETSESSGSSYHRPSTSYEPPSAPADETSSVLKEVLNFKKAELLRHPDVVALLKTVSASLKK